MRWPTVYREAHPSIPQFPVSQLAAAAAQFWRALSYILRLLHHGNHPRGHSRKPQFVAGSVGLACPGLGCDPVLHFHWCSITRVVELEGALVVNRQGIVVKIVVSFEKRPGGVCASVCVSIFALSPLVQSGVIWFSRKGWYPILSDQYLLFN